MKIAQIIQKLFVGGDWNIYIKKKSELSFESVRLPKGMWAADPMLFKVDESNFVFAEIYDIKKKKAHIGLFELVGGHPIYSGPIIEERYHMSYPCVFSCNQSYYLIPETSANGTIDIYKANSFPYEWEKIKTLRENCKCVDSTVLFYEDRFHLFTYEKSSGKWNLVHYLLDMETLSIQETDRTLYENNTGRPAGYFFTEGGKLFRPSQDCSEKYGKNIIVNEVLSVNPYVEKKIGTLSSADLGIGSQRVHTISMNESFYVYDGFTEKIELLHGIKMYLRSKKKNGK